MHPPTGSEQHLPQLGIDGLTSTDTGCVNKPSKVEGSASELSDSDDESTLYDSGTGDPDVDDDYEQIYDRGKAALASDDINVLLDCTDYVNQVLRMYQGRDGFFRLFWNGLW